MSVCNFDLKKECKNMHQTSKCYFFNVYRVVDIINNYADAARLFLY